MADEIWIKHNLGTFQQPYIFQQNRNRQSPTIAQKVAQTPAIARQPSTYQHRVPTTYRNPVSAQEPNIRSAQEPNIRSAQEPNIRNQQEPNIRNGQTPFTYNFRSPFTYRNPVSYQLPFTYQHRSPFTYRNPVGYQLPFTYNYRSPGTYRNPVNRQTPFTYNIQTTVPYSYRSPFIFNMWGSPSTPSTNVAYIFNMDTENLNANNATAATTVNIRHLVANKRIDFYFINTLDGGPGTSPITTDQESVFYTGTLSNLEARFVFNTMDLTRDDASGSGDAVIGQAFDTSGQINATHVSDNGTSVTGATTVNSLNSNVGQNVTFNSPWGNIGIDNNIDKSAMLYVSTQAATDDIEGTYVSIDSGSGGSLAIQLRANQDDNDIVTLYTRTGTFDLLVYSFEEDTT